MPPKRLFRSAVVVEPGAGWATRVMGELAPGACVLVLTTGSATGIEARRAGLSLKDSIEVFGPRSETRHVLLCITPGGEPTIAANVMKHGAGALNLDATRVSGKPWKATTTRKRPKRGFSGGWHMMAGQTPNALGRWPTNVVVVHDPECGRECAPACASHELASQARERRRITFEWYDAKGRRMKPPKDPMALARWRASEKRLVRVEVVGAARAPDYVRVRDDDALLRWFELLLPKPLLRVGYELDGEAVTGVASAAKMAAKKAAPKRAVTKDEIEAALLMRRTRSVTDFVTRPIRVPAALPFSQVGVRASTMGGALSPGLSSRFLLLCGVLAVPACSGRVADSGGRPDGGALVCDVGDAKLCSGGCSSLCADQSKCFQLSQADGSMGLGVCEDAAFNSHLSACLVCRDGDLCALRGTTSVWCVPKSVCDEKLSQGGNGCLFTDKTAYDGSVLPNGAACPAAAVNGAPAFCGGACPACASGLTCSGRSPKHPFGLCFPVAKVGTPPIVTACNPAQPCQMGSLCFVYATDAGHVSYAKELGICFVGEVCMSIATTLPGGGACLDSTGAITSGALE